jgi:DNA repair exonuclease SbcCD nuclease subunit
MIRFYLSADYHLRLTNSCGFMIDGVNSRLSDELKILSEMVNNAISHQINGFIIAGDIFDKINPSEKLRKIFLRTVIIPLIKAKITVFILMGNHDTNFDVVSFETEAELANVLLEDSIVFITEPKIIDFGDCSIYFVPFGFDIPVNNEGCQVIIGHHAIKGTETGVGVITRKGSVEVETSAFQHFQLAFFGHHHKPQQYYIGSPIRWDFGERLDDKRYLLLEADNKEFKVTSIPIEDRRFVQLVFTEKDYGKEITSEMVANAVVKLVFEGESLWVKSIDVNAIKRQCEKAGAHKVFHEFKVAKVKKNLLIDIKDTDSHEDVIVKYAEKQQIEQSLLDIGLKLFRE